MKMLVGFLLGVIGASLAIVATSAARGGTEDAARKDPIAADQPALAAPAKEPRDMKLEMALKFEESLTQVKSRSFAPFVARTNDTSDKRLSRAAGCLVALACLQMWSEVCSAEDYDHVPDRQWDYDAMGSRIISASDEIIAWMRCKAEIREYVRASVRSGFDPDLLETVGMMHWEVAARGMVQSTLSSYYAFAND